MSNARTRAIGQCSNCKAAPGQWANIGARPEEAPMTTRSILLFACAAVLLSLPLPPLGAQAQQPPTVKIPEPGVPQVMTLEGKFVRAAYNNEGYVILGYQVAN